MVQLNLALREINCKVVYFGCGLSGKTTNLEIIHQKASPDSRGELTSIATESDRTLFFDFMPLDLGTVSGMKVKFQLYTVPGQVYYNSTRKLVLRGADGVIFVADSQPSKAAENLESFENLQDCLKEQGRSLDDMPYIVQFNKRDLPGAMTIEEMRANLKLPADKPIFEAVASRGDGVLETFKALAGQLLERVKSMSTESAAKPTAHANRMTGRTEALKIGSPEQQRLQGGLGAGEKPAAPAPSRVSSQTLDKKTESPPQPQARIPVPQTGSVPIAPRAAPPPKPAPAPPPKAASAPEPPPKAASATVPGGVRPSVRQSPGAVVGSGQKPVTTSKFKTIGTGSIMVCSSARRRKGSKSTIVISVLLVVAAAAAFVILKML